MRAHKNIMTIQCMDDLEQEFFWNIKQFELAHTTGEGIVETVVLWEMLERSGEGPQPEIASAMSAIYIYTSMGGIGLLGDCEVFLGDFDCRAQEC